MFWLGLLEFSLRLKTLHCLIKANFYVIVMKCWNHKKYLFGAF